MSPNLDFETLAIDVCVQWAGVSLGTHDIDTISLRKDLEERLCQVGLKSLFQIPN